MTHFTASTLLGLALTISMDRIGLHLSKTDSNLLTGLTQAFPEATCTPSHLYFPASLPSAKMQKEFVGTGDDKIAATYSASHGSL